MSVWIYLLSLPLLLISLVYLSHTVKYYVKLTTYYVCVSAVGTGIIFLVLFVSRGVNNFMRAAKAFNVLRKCFGIKVTVRGQEYLNSDEPYIIVSNHQSSLDLMSMAAVVPNNCTCLAKEEMKYTTGPFGLAVWLSGAIFVDRRNHEKAKKTMAQAVDIIHKEKYKIWIFPEGTRNLTGTILPFKKGAFHMAVQAQVHIQPIVFSSYASFLNKKEKYFEPGNLTITCLPPITTKGMTSENVADLTEDVWKNMVEVFNETSTS